MVVHRSIPFSYCCGTLALKVEDINTRSAKKAEEGDVTTYREMPSSLNVQALLTCNLWSEVELVKCIRAEVVDIVWSPRQRVLVLLELIMARMEGYTGPAWSFDPR